ncbi:MAG: HAMP domain-containing histidine kinase [Clostridia bacterium]|nr:HAMP domain-containing histidine kinase [Clostridia bacterium]
MKAKSSLFLKILCVVLFVVFGVTALLSGAGLMIGVASGAYGLFGDYSDASAASVRDSMYRDIASRAYGKVQNMLNAYSNADGTPNNEMIAGNLQESFAVGQTNLRLGLMGPDGSEIFDTLTDSAVLGPYEFTAIREHRRPLDAAEEGFSEAERTPFAEVLYFHSREEAESTFFAGFDNGRYQGRTIADWEIAELPAPVDSEIGASLAAPIETTTASPADFDEAAITPSPYVTAQPDVYDDYPGARYALTITFAPDESNVIYRRYTDYSPAYADARALEAQFPGTTTQVEVLENNEAYLTAYLWRVETTEYPLVVGIDAALPVNDLIALAVRGADFITTHRALLVWALALSLLLMLACVVWLCIAAGHKRGVEGIHLNWIDRIPLDLYLALLLLALFGTFLLLSRVADSSTFIAYSSRPAYDDALTVAYALFFGGVFVMWLLLGLSLPVTFAARLKSGEWWRSMLTYRVLSLLWRFIKWLGRGIAYAVTSLPLYWRTALVWGGLGFLVLLALLMEGSGRLLWLWLLAEIVLTPLVVLFTIGLRRLEKGGEELAKGNLDYRIPTRHLLPALRKHAENLNSITDGMQRAVREQMKSERMKTELITNVSHDIKTPLTSIISYVKLLERDGLQSENAPQYLEVLDRQSARLKKLTDDLVEASKASSGAMQVNLERTDLHLLLEQVMGEYAEKLTAARLTPVLCLASEKPFVMADGRLLWRVFDNVFSNLCKYAQPETRVYIETAQSKNTVTVSIKNISREPLNISGDELMERFVRGDASRNTEGSGLGLSIAQSLMALQNGSVSIDIDGDLFKITVTIPAAA